MSSGKDVSTPLSTTQSLQLVDGIATMDNSKFCRIIEMEINEVRSDWVMLVTQLIITHV